MQRFAYCGTGDRLSMYRARVVPWLWFLDADVRLPHLSGEVGPRHHRTVLRDRLQDFDKSGITQSHAKWEYCVQYRETDFNFVSRLMEHEGIFY